MDGPNVKVRARNRNAFAASRAASYNSSLGSTVQPNVNLQSSQLARRELNRLEWWKPHDRVRTIHSYRCELTWAVD
jgi:hypothetical protein